MMTKFFTFLLYSLLWLFAWIPFWVLYRLSDIVFVFVYYVFRYRRKIVRRNLTNVFPDKKKSEICRIERKFYLHFCDYILETIKLIHLSKATMRRRFTFKNIHLLDEYYENGQNLIVFLGHYGNWEWTTFARAAQLNHHHEFKAYSVYRPQSSKVFDHLMWKLRSKSGTVLVPQKQVMRTIIEMKRNQTPGFLCFIADQRPMRSYFWMQWLNQRTTPFVATERIAARASYPVLYLDIRKPKRGYYTGEFIVITEDAGQLPEFELTTQYMRLMEKTILSEPAYWLWTHNRWKHKRKFRDL